MAQAGSDGTTKQLCLKCDRPYYTHSPSLFCWQCKRDATKAKSRYRDLLCPSHQKIGNDTPRTGSLDRDLSEPTEQKITVNGAVLEITPPIR